MRKIVLALALTLLPVSTYPTPAAPSRICFSQRPIQMEKSEARLEQQKSKWAPNGMKVLIIHGKRRLVERQGVPPVEKREIVPILKEGV
ncbi:MAG TPA: hypothetical protein VNL73_05320 [Verrucomicrobiae bacterium]|nr:hypothetical protein [Verrucomicrobiae bacterium]